MPDKQPPGPPAIPPAVEPRRRGRPKGDKLPLTPAERAKRYRQRKAKARWLRQPPPA